MTKKWKIAVLVVVIIVSGIYLSLRSGALTEPFRRIVLSPLTRQIPWPVTVGRVSLSFIPSAVVFSDVSILESKESARPLVEIKEIKIVFSPWSLLTEVTIISRIRLTEPRFHLDNLPSGSSAGKWPPEWFQGTKESPLRKPTVLVVRDFQIRNGSIKLGRDSDHWMVGLERFNAEIVPSLDMKAFQAHLASEGVEVRAGDYKKRLNRAELTLSAGPDEIHIQEAELVSGEIRLTGSGRIRNRQSPEYSGSVEASFPLSELRDYVQSVNNLEGQARVKGVFSGQQSVFSVSGEASANDLKWKQVPIGTVETGFEFKDKILSVSGLEASVLDGTARGEGEIRLATAPPGYRVSLNLDEISVERLTRLAALKPVLPRHRLGGTIDLEGQGAKPESLSGHGNLALRLPSGYRDPGTPPENWTAWVNRLRKIEGSVAIDHGAVHLESGTAKSENSEGKATGVLESDGRLAIDFRMSSREVNEFTPLMKLDFVSGTAEMDGSISGTIKKPVVAAEGILKEAEIRGRRFDSVSGRIEFRFPRLDFHSARFSTATSQYELEGFLSFDESLPARPYFNFAAGVRNGMPGEVVALFYKEIPVTTPANGEIRVEGDPKEFSVTGFLTIGPGEIYSQEIDGGELDLSVTRQEVSFNRITARRGSTTVTGVGRIQYDGRFEFDAESSGGHLEDVSWVRTHWEGVSALITGRFRGSGLLKNPEFGARFDLGEVRYQDRVYGNGTLDGTVADNRLEFSARLDNGLSTRGDLDFSGDLPFNIEVALDRFQAKPALDLLKLSPLFATEDLSAVGTGMLTAKGTLKDLKNSAFTLRLNPVNLKIGPVSMSNVRDIRVEMSGGSVVIRSLEMQGEKSRLEVTGGLELQKSYNLSLKGEGDLGLLLAMSEDITLAHGKARAAVQIQEDWNHPNIRGTVSVRDGRLISQTIGQLLILETFELSFNNNQAILDSFEGKLGGGKVSASGKWELNGLTVTRFAVNFDCHSVRLVPVTGFSSTVDASLQYGGEGESRWINGTMYVQRASYDRRLDWKTLVVEMFKRERGTLEAESSLGRTRLNVQITGRDNILINNNMAKVPFEMDLLLKGTLGQPVLLGRLEATGGKIYFRNNEFKVTSASVDFINPDRIRPIFDIQASTRIRSSYLVNLSLVGPADRFDLTLSSDPPLSDHEILALLTFGKEPDEIDDASMEIIGATEAFDLLTGQLQVAVEEKVKALTGIDRIQVDPYFSSTKSASTARVTVSKRLWEDSLFVTYATTMDASGEDIIQMEYVINDNVSLVGVRDELGIVGGDLKFRFEFR